VTGAVKGEKHTAAFEGSKRPGLFPQRVFRGKGVAGGRICTAGRTVYSGGR
jgi:hypothetical protein